MPAGRGQRDAAQAGRLQERSINSQTDCLHTYTAQRSAALQATRGRTSPEEDGLQGAGLVEAPAGRHLPDQQVDVPLHAVLYRRRLRRVPLPHRNHREVAVPALALAEGQVHIGGHRLGGGGGGGVSGGSSGRAGCQPGAPALLLLLLLGF